MTTAPRDQPLPADSVSFVLCVEANQLERQARLLCESIREYAGQYAGCPIFAVSPRPELALREEAICRLRDLDVTYVAESLNTTGHPYGSINRIVVGAWAETRLTSSHLVILDTDTLFVGEPQFTAADVGVRPVDMKGSASEGPSDPLEGFWSRVCAIAEIDLDTLPMLKTTIDGRLIRSSYNGGFAAVRRALGILTRTRDVFDQMFSQDLRPLAGSGINVRASTGFVGLEASEWWGSSQAALSAAIWSKTRDVRVYGPEYNIPLHLVALDTYDWQLSEGSAPCLLHYHYLLEPEHHAAFLAVLSKIGCSERTKSWLNRQLVRSQ